MQVILNKPLHLLKNFSSGVCLFLFYYYLFIECGKKFFVEFLQQRIGVSCIIRFSEIKGYSKINRVIRLLNQAFQNNTCIRHHQFYIFWKIIKLIAIRNENFACHHIRLLVIKINICSSSVSYTHL